jgi:hypothetical protein
MFSLKNFYKPAPAQVQRIAAVCKALGGMTAPAALTEKYKWIVGVGFVLAAVGEGLEKLSAAPHDATGRCLTRKCCLMKLTTAETKKYALLVVKSSTGGLSAPERTAYEALVTKMGKPEPRKKAKAKTKSATSKPASAK